MQYSPQCWSTGFFVNYPKRLWNMFDLRNPHTKKNINRPGARETTLHRRAGNQNIPTPLHADTLSRPG